LNHPGFRPRVGQQVADREPFRLGRDVQGGDARPAGGIDGEDERPTGINRLAFARSRLRREKAQDRPPRQPD
jgi:hypothetical protein